MEEKEIFFNENNGQNQDDFQQRYTQWQQRYQEFQDKLEDFRYWQFELSYHVATLEQQRRNLKDRHDALLRATEQRKDGYPSLAPQCHTREGGGHQETASQARPRLYIVK